MPKVSTTTQTPTTIRNLAKRMADSSGILLAVADKLEENKIGSLEVTNAKGMRLGIASIEAFAEAAKSLMWKAMEDRGDFSTVTDVEKPAKGKKK